MQTKVFFKKPSVFKKTTLAVALLTSFGYANAQLLNEQIYDDGSAALEPANNSDLELDKAVWMNPLLNGADQGLVYRNPNNSNTLVVSGANLVVDYNTNQAPQFIIGGFSKDAESVTGNQVTIVQANGAGNIYGGLSHYTNTTPNSSDPSANTSISLGNTKNPLANNNTVIIHDNAGTIDGSVYGGNATLSITTGNAQGGYQEAISNANANSAQLQANGNQLTIGSGSTISNDFVGGSVTLSITTGNSTVNSSAATVVDSSINAANTQLDASFNEQTVKSGALIDHNVIGGDVTLAITGGSAIIDVTYNTNTGAPSFVNAMDAQLHANQNRITIEDNSNIGNNLIGGNAKSLITTQMASQPSYLGVSSGYVNTANSQISADGNSLEVGSGSIIGNDLIGGNAISSISTEYSTSQTVTDTYANVSNGQIHANSNQLTVGSNSVIGNDAVGGNASLSITTGLARSSDNPNNISNTSADISNIQIHADVNYLEIGQNTTIANNLIGGHTNVSIITADALNYNSQSGSANAGVNATNASFHADGNEVFFDGHLTGANSAIYAGKVTLDVQTGNEVLDGSFSAQGTFDNSNSMATTTGNTVTIGENATFAAGSSLYGGQIEFNPTTDYRTEAYDAFTENKLIYNAKTKAQFDTIANFEYYEFAINPDYRNQLNTGDALVTANNIVLGTDTSNVSETSDIRQSQISVSAIHSGATLNPGDQFLLMDTGSEFSGNGATGSVQQGISLKYDIETTVHNNQVIATVMGQPTLNEEVKSLSEGYFSSNMLPSRGADLLAYEAIDTIKLQNANGFVPFIMTSAQRNRYNSGSHITSNDVLLAGGLSYRQDNMTAAAIIEAGWGSYDSYNNFSNTANVHGTGHNSYNGLALLGRYDFDNGFYTDASLRYGKTQTTFNTKDIQNMATGEYASYKLKPNYAGAHMGVGYLFALNSNNTLDLSAKYLWTKTQGKDATIAGDHFQFDTVDSNRLRVDGVVNHQYNSNVTLRAGFGYEYEFEGKANGHVQGFRFNAPSFKGGTVIGSLGATLKPSETSPFSFDVKLQGYGGKREGLGLGVKMDYAF